MEKGKITANRKRPKGYWNEPRITSKASNYSSLKEWRIEDYPSYDAAIKRGLTKKIAQKMGWQVGVPIIWTYDFCKKRAGKYSTITQWRSDDPHSYDAACRHGYISQLKKELNLKSSVRFDRTYDEILEVANNFKSVREWQRYSAKTYQYALSRGWKDGICKSLGFNYKPSKKGTI